MTHYRMTRVLFCFVSDMFPSDSYFLLLFEDKMQSVLRFLAIGDSLTAGYCEFGLSNHPYAIHLTNLFSSANIPVIVDEHGVSGERVVPSMVKRLETLLFNRNSPDYDWILILGGTNDLGFKPSAEKIFNEGLKLMYDMVLQRTNEKTKLAVITIIENGHYSPENIHDKQRQTLNEMIRNFAQNYEDQNRICLIDLDKSLPYHNIKDINQRKSYLG